MFAAPPSALPLRRARTAPRTRAVLTVLAAGILLLTGATSAHAHARLERSLPAADAVLSTPPTAVELWFNELLDDEFNDIAVFRAGRDGAPADQTNLATAKPRVDDADRTRLTAPLAELASGAYVIQWKVLSRDGHSARGRVLFRVGAAE